MPDAKPTTDRAFELLVYAPVGLALYVRDMLPGMMGVFVMRGRREVDQRLHPDKSSGPTLPTMPIPGIPGVPLPSMPKMPDMSSPEVRQKVGDSIGMARTVAEGGVGVARDLAGTAMHGFLAWRASTTDVPPTAPPTAPSEAERTWHTDVADDDTVAARTESDATGAWTELDVTRVPTRTPPVPDPGVTGTPDVASLSIPDYDELSASQVVERLEGLDPASLEAIRRYETAHRGRNTILGKIAQLG